MTGSESGIARLVANLSPITVLGLVILAGCAPPPRVVTENPPHYVMIHQPMGIDGSDATLRVGADNAADAACRKHERRAKLPASAVDCIHWHWMLRVCLSYQYTYECVED